ncbi:MAG TPA: hypothetical protein VGP08_06635 [Pyrinomonadaceae bacterium]|jgi:hypothetical protein|nr:hypothetical protein [Pyrinomonadaceae bacterium]
MRTLAGVCTTLCAAVMSFGVMTGAACSQSGARSAGGNGNEVRAMNNSNSTGGGAADGANSKGSNATGPSNVARPAALDDADAAQKTQLELKADIRREAGGDIVVEYSVTNGGARPVLLVNRGDTSFGLGPGRVYVEPHEDGTVYLTQQGYTLPPGYSGPAPTAAIYPGVSELAPGKTATETLRVRAPKSRQHPYGRYYKQVAVPEPLRRVRFCLGVLKGDAQTKTTRGTRVLTSLQGVAAQELLCTETKELN